VCVVADRASAAEEHAEPDDDLTPSRVAGQRIARRWPWAPLGVGAAGLVLAALLAPAEPLPLPLEARWLAAYLLFVLLPGWLLVSLLMPARVACWRAGERLETTVLVVAAGYGLAVLLGLALHAIFRPITPWQIAAGGGLLVLTLALAVSRRGASIRPSRASLKPDSPSRVISRPDCVPPGPLSRTRERGERVRGNESLLPLLLVLAVAVPLRLFDLGWSEFQGDEARVMLRAMAALQGADGALAAHRKVPGEILLAYLFAGSLGQIVEHVARLPFALASVGAVLAFYSLAHKLLGGRAALAAGLLLAVNGYFVAFGRILQYDSLAFFLGIAGLICCWRFGRDDGSRADATAWAGLGALLLGCAALVALGAVFLVPPALLLAWPGLVRHRRSWSVLAAWTWPIVPGLLAAALVLGADGPADGPSGIWSYLGPRLGGNRPYWHGTLFLRSTEHYLSSPYVLALLIAGASAILLGLLGVARATSGRGNLIRLGIVIAVAALSWDRPLVALALGALLALVLVLQVPAQRPDRRTDEGNRLPLGRYFGRYFGQHLGMRVALLWAAGPLFVHLLLIRVPGTHFREAFPGLILILAALAMPALARRRSGLVVGTLLAMLVVGAGHYSWVTLVQRLPEYQLTYPADRHPLDWTARDGRGIGGVFGIAHRHGWKALGVLSTEGTLAGGFATNESPAIAAWYLRRPQGCEGALEYVFRVPRAPHDRNLAVPVRLPVGYQTRGQVRMYGRPTIAIQMPPTATARLGEIPAEAYEERFDRELASAWRPVDELYRADLGAAAARRACLNRDQPPGDPLQAG
jgi:hypothetical protein